MLHMDGGHLCNCPFGVAGGGGAQIFKSVINLALKLFYMSHM